MSLLLSLNEISLLRKYKSIICAIYIVQQKHTAIFIQLNLYTAIFIQLNTFTPLLQDKVCESYKYRKDHY